MFKCDQCGELEYVLIDGYAFGGTLLEDVMFQVHKKGNAFCVSIDPGSSEYFKDLNTKKWLKAAKDYAENLDIGTCPKCRDDVDVSGLFKERGKICWLKSEE